MNLTGVHFLLSYQCTYECDHCFVWSSPRAGGTMTINQIRDLLQQASDLGTVTSVYFEGGEPFIFYPVMLEGLAEASRLGFTTGVVSNCYWSTSQADAELWLRPFAELNVADLSLSSDAFHQGEEQASGPRWAQEAAQALGLSERVITIEGPGECVERDARGEPIVGGSVRFRGRAAEKLVEGLPRRPWQSFSECPDEDLAEPGRVHIDAFGNVHLCQGIVIGNLNRNSLCEIVNDYDPHTHPIAGPLLSGGPAELARTLGFSTEEGYVDACHLCYAARVAARPRFPNELAPDQVYGVEPGENALPG